jgi:tRNA 2-thiouridine synthesizing protein A
VITLDCTGMLCPLPIIELAREFGALPVGVELELISDDPAAATDVAAWCRMTGQELVQTADRTEPGRAVATAYRIRKVSVSKA